MSFTKDDLKDGMVCTLRAGGVGTFLHGYFLCEQREQAGVVSPYKASEWSDIFTDIEDTDDDIMKITYGGKTVFEREEWHELTIDEAFELLKSGPVLGQAYCAHKEIWDTLALQDLRPWSECRYLAAERQYRKFRIKK